MSDQGDSELERARETVNALARRVDTAAGWNALEATINRVPGRRARRGAQLAVVLAAVVALVAGAIYARHDSSRGSAVVVTEPTPDATPADCTLPTLPAPGTGRPSSGRSSLGLTGPAVAELKGDAALDAFELDGGELSVSPPAAGDVPSVSAAQAECAALASSNANGWSIQDLAQASGVAIGYGRVSVAPALIASAQEPAYLGGKTDNNTSPTLPAATPYEHRLAWMVVVKDMEVFNTPPSNGRGLTSTTSSGAATSFGYVVFLVDAHTGSDALLYTEDARDGQASVTVPVERVSVPWTLVSRSPDGYSGQIAATVLPCDGYPDPVDVDRDRAAVGVVVERPVGASCGPARQVTIMVRAATVTADLPDNLAHDPLGPDITLPSAPDAPSPGETGGVLRLVNDSENGTTIQMTVGSVLSIGPLHDGSNYAATPVTSDDPTVLGLVDGTVNGEIGEFRAWRAGSADLSQPPSACNPKGKGQPCTGPWILHVIVK